MSYLVPNNRETVTSVGSAWIICRSKSFAGRIYYFNTLTGEAVWNLSETEVEIARRRTKILQCQPGFVIENCPEPPESPKEDPTSNKLPSSGINQVLQHNMVPAKLYNKQVNSNRFPATATLCTPHQYHVCSPMNPIQCNIPVGSVLNPPIWNAAPHQIFVTPTYSQPQPFTSNNDYDHVYLNNMSNTPSNSFTRLSGDGHANTKFQIRHNKYQHHKSLKNCRVNKLKINNNTIDLRLLLSLKRRENQLKEKVSQPRANAAAINNNKYKKGDLDPLSTRIRRESNYCLNPNEEKDVVNDDVYENLTFTLKDKIQDSPHSSRIRRRSYSFHANEENNEKNYWLEHLAIKNSGTSQGAFSSLQTCRRRSIGFSANEGENDEDNDLLEQSNDKYTDTNQGDFSQQPSRVRSFSFSDNQKEETDEANEWLQHLNNINLNQSDVSPLSTHRKSVCFKLNEKDSDSNAWLEAKLKTQRDTNSSERKSSTSLSQVKENTDVIYIVPDSNVFLNNINLLDDILNTDKEYCLLVPKMVMNKIQAATKSLCPVLAYKALYFIWQQHEADLAIIEDGSEENDINKDDLLNFCCQLIDQEIHVVLLTDNTELINSNNAYNTNVRMITTVKMQQLVDEYKCCETTTTSIDTEALANVKFTIENDSHIQHNEEVIKSPMTKCMDYGKSFDENPTENRGADNVFQKDKKTCDVGIQASCNFASVSSLSNTDVRKEVLLPDSTKVNANVPCKTGRIKLKRNFTTVSKKNTWNQYNTNLTFSLANDRTKAGDGAESTYPVTDSTVNENTLLNYRKSFDENQAENRCSDNVFQKDKKTCDVGIPASCNFPSVSSLSNTDVRKEVLPESTKVNANVPCKTGQIKLKRNFTTVSKKNTWNQYNTNLTFSLANDRTKAGDGAESTYPVKDSTVNENTLLNYRKSFDENPAENRCSDNVFQKDKKTCDVGIQASCNLPSVSSLSITDVRKEVLLPESTKVNDNVPCKTGQIKLKRNFTTVCKKKTWNQYNTNLTFSLANDRNKAGDGAESTYPVTDSTVNENTLLNYRKSFDENQAENCCSDNVFQKDKKTCDVGIQASCNFHSVSSLSNTDVRKEVLLPDSTKVNANVPCKTGRIKLKRNFSSVSKKNTWNQYNTNLTFSLANDRTKTGDGAESTYPVTDSTVNENTLSDGKKFTWSPFSDTCKVSYKMNEGSDTSSIVFRNVNQRENITIEDSNSVISNTTSNVDTESERGGVQKANTNIDDGIVMFEVSDSRMEEALRVKMDEWVYRFEQIMEEALSQLLECEPAFALEAFPPPWTLHEAAECVRKRSHDPDVLTAAERLLAVSRDHGGLRGKIKSNISPHIYMELYSYGVYLIDALEDVSSGNEDLQTASEALAKLLNDVQHSDPDAQDSFTDISAQECDANVTTDKDRSPVKANQGSKKHEVLKGSPIMNNKKQSRESTPRKYNLRFQRKNYLEENRETSDNVTFIRTIDPESSFFSSLDLKKISSSDNPTVTEKPQHIIGSGSSDNIQEKSPSFQNTNEHISSSGESTAPILNGDPKMNEPKIIINFFKCVEFEEKLKHKTGLLDNQDLTYDDEDDTEKGGLMINEDLTEGYDSNNFMDNDYYTNYVEDLWYDGHNPEENDLGSLKNAKALNTNDGDKAVTFKLVMEGLESGILKAYTSIRDFCVRSSESLQSEDLSADDTSRMLARAKKTSTYICKVCDQLESILRRENTHKSIFHILRKKEFADVVVEDGDMEDYRDYIGNCLEQGLILKETVELVLRACKLKAA